LALIAVWVHLITLNLINIKQFCLTYLLVSNIQGKENLMFFYEFMERLFLLLLLLFGFSLLFNNWNQTDFNLWRSPGGHELDFNRISATSETRPIIISTDEKITTEVFQKNHKSVVNIVTTYLGMNFWRQVIPEQG
jgi:hypothetical protein